MKINSLTKFYHKETKEQYYILNSWSWSENEYWFSFIKSDFDNTLKYSDWEYLGKIITMNEKNIENYFNIVQYKNIYKLEKINGK